MPATPKTGQNLIDKFEQYTDDTTELSSTDELDLVNKIYRKILSSHAWIFLIKDSGLLPINYDSGTTLYYITLPADFDYIPITSGDTDTGAYGLDKTIYTVDSAGNSYPYKVINFTDRRQYLRGDAVTYIDKAAGRIVFTGTPTNSYASFDYIYSPDDIALGTSPVFPAQFHDMIFHGMMEDDYMCQIFDKVRSYAQEHNGAFQGYLDDLSSWNSQFYAQ